MSVIIILVIVGIVVAGGFLFGFIWAVRNGQYDDLYSPSVRILFDEPKTNESSQPVTTTPSDNIKKTETKSLNKCD